MKHIVRLFVGFGTFLLAVLALPFFVGHFSPITDMLPGAFWELPFVVMVWYLGLIQLVALGILIALSYFMGWLFLALLPRKNTKAG